MSSSQCQRSQIWWLSFGLLWLLGNPSAAATPDHSTGTLTKAVLEINNDQSPTLGQGSCTSEQKVLLTLPESLTNEYDDFQVMLESGSKSATKAPECKASVAANQSVKAWSPTDIKQKNLLTPGQCKKGSAGLNTLCIYTGEVGQEGKLVASVSFHFDTAVAKIDSIVDQSAANGIALFTVKYTGKISTIETCYAKYVKDMPPFDKEKDCKSNSFTPWTQAPPKIKISGLKNDVEYIFYVRTLDQNNTPGEYYDSFKLTPIPVVFPLASYNGNGGELTFSCQSSSSNPIGFLVMVLALALCLRLRRFGKFSLSPVVLALVFLIPAEESHAHFGQVNIGFLGSMYRPDLDNEKLSDGSTVFPFYKGFFRKKTSDEDGPITPLMGLEVDMHLFDGFGSLQLGLGLGYTFVNGFAMGMDSAGKPDVDKATTVKTSLHMYQLRPQLTYLFDYFKDYVPLVPYVRAAAIMHGYSFRNEIETDDVLKHDANGFRFGYQGAAGLMLMLNFLEPGAMRTAKGSGFFNNVYLKGELSYTKIDTFGKDGFQFSPKDIMGTGMPLLWTFGLGFELP